MTTDVMVQGNRVGTARMRARIAGALYVVSVTTAVMGEFVVPGRMGPADVVIPVTCYAAAMLLLFGIFAPVDRWACVGVLAFGLAGLGLEAARWQPRGVNAAMVLHGAYCLLLGWVMLRARFVPRWLGAAMGLAGVIWLPYLSPVLARIMAPWNTAVGVIGEALPMLWLLAMGVNERRWMEQAEAGGRR